jgi:4'-phosphopantetheinyl transferase EntD
MTCVRRASNGIFSQLPDRLDAFARAHPELNAGCRVIAVGDEFALTPAELRPISRSIVSVRRASGAARIVARKLLAQLDAPPPIELPRSTSGAPRWPPGFVGSLAHDDEFAVAVVARSRSVRSVGIDIEPVLPLPEDLLQIVTTPHEREQLDKDLVSARLLFCIKEAVYKATFPVDGVFLEHHDVDVCLTSSIARTSTGRGIRFYAIARPRLVAIAMLTT